MAKIRKKSNKARERGGMVLTGSTHPAMVSAVANGARLERGTFEVAKVANPLGEFIVRGDVRRHAAVRRVPQFETLARLGVINREQADCLAWYAARRSLAQSGLFKCGLDVSGGGSPSMHIPTTEAAAAARSDVDWARGYIEPQCLPVFDAVMDDDASFIEHARREAAGRYVRVSVRRARLLARDLFARAAAQLAAGVKGFVIMDLAA